MSEKTIHANRGERWDQLCFRIYGSLTEKMMMDLREANRALSNSMVSFTFEGGELVNVPELDTDTETETTERPPWAN